MNETTDIIQQIKEGTQPAMDKWQVDFKAWIQNLNIYCRQTVYEDVGSRDAYKIYAAKCNAGYSNSLERFFGRSDQDLTNMISKEAAVKMLKIDVAVTKKLKGIEVKSIELLHFSPYTISGFCEGSWRINGDKVFSFRSVYAGGYNIQCLHVRTLYKFK